MDGKSLHIWFYTMSVLILTKIIKINKINSFSKGFKISNVTRKYNLSHQNVFIRHSKYPLWDSQQEAIQAGI